MRLNLTNWSVLLLLAAVSAPAATITVDFEGLADSSPVGNFYAAQGVTFSTGIILLSGAFGGSLNEAEFPPNSLASVFVNESGTTTVSFITPITFFRGFFTYGGPLTLNFYDAGNTLLTSILSGFSANLALSGDPGSVPNELLTAAVLANATHLDILAPNADFTLDDLQFETVDGNVGAVPEPSTFFLLLGGAAALAVLRGRAKYSSSAKRGDSCEL